MIHLFFILKKESNIKIFAQQRARKIEEINFPCHESQLNLIISFEFSG